MRLRTARLCLDCEELHESQQCPVCLSEAVVCLTLSIPAEKRRAPRFPSAIKVTLKPVVPRAHRALAKTRRVRPRCTRRKPLGVAVQRPETVAAGVGSCQKDVQQ
jgi:hypothetical protein